MRPVVPIELRFMSNLVFVGFLFVMDGQTDGRTNGRTDGWTDG